MVDIDKDGMPSQIFADSLWTRPTDRDFAKGYANIVNGVITVTQKLKDDLKAYVKEKKIVLPILRSYKVSSQKAGLAIKFNNIEGREVCMLPHYGTHRSWNTDYHHYAWGYFEMVPDMIISLKRDPMRLRNSQTFRSFTSSVVPSSGFTLSRLSLLLQDAGFIFPRISQPDVVRKELEGEIQWSSYFQVREQSLRNMDTYMRSDHTDLRQGFVNIINGVASLRPELDAQLDHAQKTVSSAVKESSERWMLVSYNLDDYGVTNLIWARADKELVKKRSVTISSRESGFQSGEGPDFDLARDEMFKTLAEATPKILLRTIVSRMLERDEAEEATPFFREAIQSLLKYAKE